MRGPRSLKRCPRGARDEGHAVCRPGGGWRSRTSRLRRSAPRWAAVDRDTRDLWHRGAWRGGRRPLERGLTSGQEPVAWARGHARERPAVRPPERRQPCRERARGRCRGGSGCVAHGRTDEPVPLAPVACAPSSQAPRADPSARPTRPACPPTGPARAAGRRRRDRPDRARSARLARPSGLFSRMTRASIAVGPRLEPERLHRDRRGRRCVRCPMPAAPIAIRCASTAAGRSPAQTADSVTQAGSRAITRRPVARTDS